MVDSRGLVGFKVCKFKKTNLFIKNCNTAGFADFTNTGATDTDGRGGGCVKCSVTALCAVLVEPWPGARCV